MSITNDLPRQLRTIVRRLWRSPLFTVTSVVTLALGIGATTAIFSIVNAVLLKPLPYEDPDRLIGAWYTAPGVGFPQIGQAAGTYVTLREESELFDGAGIWTSDLVAVTGAGDPEQLSAMDVSEDLFATLGVQTMLGRSFTPEDVKPESARTVVLGHEYWQRRFGGASDVLGDSLTIDGNPAEIIGVMPPGFRLLDRPSEIYLPITIDRSRLGLGQFNYQGVLRLKPGVTLEQANAELDRLLPVTGEKFPGGVPIGMLEEANFAAAVHLLEEDVVGNVRQVLWVLLGTVCVVLLIACANVANLFLVRAEGRHREMAVRTAMGAGRASLMTHFLLESVLLGLLGGLLGLGLAAAGLRLLVRLGPSTLPRLSEIGIDARVLLFSLVVSVLAGLLFGLFPVLRLGVDNLVEGLKEGGRGGGAGHNRQRLRSSLVVAQVALALVLLVGSGLMMRSFRALRSVHPGFAHPEEVLTFGVAIPPGEVEQAIDTLPLFERMASEIEALPGVVSVGVSSSVPMDQRTSADPIYVEGFPVPEGQLPVVRRFKFIAGGHHRTIQAPLLAGRSIDWSDLHERRPVVVVTRNFADDYWSDPAEAIGKRVRQLDVDPETGKEGRWREIVGVVGDVYDDGVDQEPVALVYFPAVMEDFWNSDLFVWRNMVFSVRSERASPSSHLPEIRDIVWSVNRNLPLATVRTLDELYQRSLARSSFTLVMLGIASLVALLLGTIGIYGVISYLVSQRTREIGVRMALGAKRSDVSGMMVRQGAWLAGAGIGVGLLGALALSRLMGALLFGVEATDPLTYAVVATVLGAIALLASVLAARRATRVDPVVALRSE